MIYNQAEVFRWGRCSRVRSSCPIVWATYRNDRQGSNDSTGRRRMPVSKKRRRAKSNPRSTKGSSTRVTLPDRRAMEGFMAAIGGRQANDAMAKAQQVMYDAWDQTDSRARTALAHKALTIS